MEGIPEKPKSDYLTQYHTIQHGNDDSSALEYLTNLGLEAEDLRGKTILDLGIGQTNRFTREIEKAGIKCTIFGLSPDMNLDGYREKMRAANPGTTPRVAAGIAQEMPFKSETFDLILNMYSLSFYNLSHTKMKDVEAYVAEMYRVLRPGGEVRMGPIYDFGDDQYQILSDVARKNNMHVEKGNDFFRLAKEG